MLYYVLWIYVLPKIGKYTVRQENVVLEGGATTHRLVKVPNEKLADWDEQHDATGKAILHQINVSEAKGADY